MITVSFCIPKATAEQEQFCAKMTTRARAEGALAGYLGVGISSDQAYKSLYNVRLWVRGFNDEAAANRFMGWLTAQGISSSVTGLPPAKPAPPPPQPPTNYHRYPR